MPVPPRPEGEAGREDVPGAAERDRIRQELTQEEMDSHFEEWIRELRGKAYIKIL